MDFLLTLTLTSVLFIVMLGLLDVTHRKELKKRRCRPEDILRDPFEDEL